jgi:hypothetical protein
MLQPCLDEANSLYQALQQAIRARDIIKVRLSTDTQQLIIDETAEVVNTETGEGVIVDTIPGTEIPPSFSEIINTIDAIYTAGGDDLTSLITFLRTLTQDKVDTAQSAFDAFTCCD